VEQGVADLVRDGLREVEDDRSFLARHRQHLPERLLSVGIPFGLDGPVAPPSPKDQRIVDEGRHWGRFMQHFWDVGDRSIFDIRIRGTHPPFYVAGVIEPDDRDDRHPYAYFSTAAGKVSFAWLDQLAGRHAVDVGCGGGQYGLEAARRGLHVVGFDPSFGEVALGRRHAREQGVTTIDYLRAEPSHPPLRPGAFSLLMAKDALHHVPDLAEVFPQLLRLLEPKGHVVCQEHAGKALRKEALLGLLRPRVIEKIRSRYPKVEIPAELLRDSANEDVSTFAIRPLLEQYFIRMDSVEDLFLANELELLMHFAFGKRRWFSWPFYPLGMAAEKVLLLLGDRQHITFAGRLKDDVRL
jgi:SAM-dependent methyltransferase